MTPSRVFVEVDQLRIDSAARNPHLRVRMIVEAIQVALPNATAIRIDAGTVRLTERGTRYVYPTPPVCQKAIIKATSPQAFSFTPSTRWLASSAACVANCMAALHTSSLS